jgi:hypothetical protein
MLHKDELILVGKVTGNKHLQRNAYKSIIPTEHYFKRNIYFKNHPPKKIFTLNRVHLFRHQVKFSHSIFHGLTVNSFVTDHITTKTLSLHPESTGPRAC